MKTILFTQITLLLFVIPNFSWAQVITVTGYVNNGTNGNALENVTIFEVNSGIGTITNQNGFYKLILERGTLKLNVTDGGFKAFTQTLELTSDTTLTVMLEPDSLHDRNRQKKTDESKSDKKEGPRRNFKLF
ncbi:carboxypeptidase-like regulatory domain-containing protein [uncultured Draconibacterium sp.]|uniref:carboxypeptidase-like regulatory domain-containing protein n=1 Tax=uncultured Draconibacterium sp. TaxID=1573823 RepID=UPI003217571F